MSELENNLVVRAELSKTIHRKEAVLRKLIKAEGVLKTELGQTQVKRKALNAEINELIRHLEEIGGPPAPELLNEPNN